MWQNWVLLYVGLWIAYSGFLFGKPVKWHNVCFGIIIIIFSTWAGLRSKKLRQKGDNK
ncbi:hypothetical protein KAU13_02745 [candidate division WOR-3 bacterium]|nr:hypothetical protein [candidate division WOR-3 bacterium]MCK4584313.1 hypothetical protein [candidate division WOR-3 bacterium]